MKKVMFICKRNSCRSQMAEGFAKILGSKNIQVNSSGLEATEVDTKAIEIMSEVGIDISKQTSQPLADFNAEDYDAVISLCGCGVNLPPEWVSREIFEDWQLDDPQGKSLKTFREIRDEIKELVSLLVEKISKD
jgi:arsenate reductase